MKIIHTADLHLNSALTFNFNTEQANLLNNKVFIAFENLIKDALKNGVEVIIIAGDLFDNDKTSLSAFNNFKNLINATPSIKFIFVYDNHDFLPIQNAYKDFPSNFIVLTNNSYTLDNVCFCPILENLNLNSEFFNIVIGHGDLAEINLNNLKNQRIDYLALGHIHSFSINQLDFRGKYAYSGCLSSRGFDECGSKGYVFIDTQTKNYNFVPINTLNFYHEEINLTNILSQTMPSVIQNTLSKYHKNSAIKVVFVGEKQKDVSIDLNYYNQKYLQDYFYIEFKDKSVISTKEKNGNILLNEFIKVVEENNYPQEIKQKILNLGAELLK